MNQADIRVLVRALYLLEEWSVQIDGEWGAARELDQIEADGELQSEIEDLRALVARLRQSTPQ